MPINRRLVFVLAIIFMLSSYYGCSDDDEVEDECSVVDSAYATKVIGPNAGKINEPIDFEVYYDLINGCGTFSEFIATENDSIHHIELKALYTGCQCDKTLYSGRIKYTFIPQSVGNHYLRFQGKQSAQVEVVLSIN